MATYNYDAMEIEELESLRERLQLEMEHLREEFMKSGIVLNQKRRIVEILEIEGEGKNQ